MITAKEAQERSLTQEDIEFYQRFQDAVIESAIKKKRADAPWLAHMYSWELEEILPRYGIRATKAEINRLDSFRGFTFKLFHPYKEAGYSSRWDTYAHPANERITWGLANVSKTNKSEKENE